MSDPIRYAILDNASDDAGLWTLPYRLRQEVAGEMVELHPRRDGRIPRSRMPAALTATWRDGSLLATCSYS
jgi:hypothetical protein